MQHFQPILIVIGILAIAAVLIHGYLLSRKQRIPVTDSYSDAGDILSEKTTVNSQDGIVGDVRIIRASSESEDQSSDFLVALEADKIEEINFDANVSHQELPENVELQRIEDNFLETPILTEHEQITELVDLEKEAPLVEEIEAFIGLDDVEKAAEVKKPVQEAQDIFIFNVVAKEESHVRGHELLQFFLTAGFRFGEMSIFHRHLNSDGTGPILFSIANMMAPGIFDPENMEQFRSQGVSFFLTAPNHDINIKKAFDMMLVAVEQMAEEFDCLVLNAEREPLTEQEFRNYHERLLHYI